MQNSLNVYIEGIYVDVTRGVVIDVRLNVLMAPGCTTCA